VEELIRIKTRVDPKMITWMQFVTIVGSLGISKPSAQFLPSVSFVRTSITNSISSPLGGRHSQLLASMEVLIRVWNSSILRCERLMDMTHC
jgi:hypothetical protein